MAGKINRQSDKDDKEIEEVYRMDAEENHREEIAENILFQKEQKEKENMRKRNKRASFTNDEIEVNKYKTPLMTDLNNQNLYIIFYLVSECRI